MKLRGSKSAHEATFDLTPMIDVVLLLIIFFTLTSQFSHVSLAPMDLPDERGEEQQNTDTPFLIVVDVARDGALTIDGDEYNPDGVRNLVAAAAEQAGAADQLEVIVRGDRLVTAAQLDPLVHALAEAGVTTWKLATTGSGPQTPGTGG